MSCNHVRWEWYFPLASFPTNQGIIIMASGITTTKPGWMFVECYMELHCVHGPKHQVLVSSSLCIGGVRPIITHAARSYLPCVAPVPSIAIAPLPPRLTQLRMRWWPPGKLFRSSCHATVGPWIPRKGRWRRKNFLMPPFDCCRTFEHRLYLSGGYVS